MTERADSRQGTDDPPATELTAAEDALTALRELANRNARRGQRYVWRRPRSKR